MSEQQVRGYLVRLRVAGWQIIEFEGGGADTVRLREDQEVWVDAYSADDAAAQAVIQIRGRKDHCVLTATVVCVEASPSG